MSRKTNKGSKVKPIKKMSNGHPYNLENWREVARLAFGDNSKAVAYVDSEIEKLGKKHRPELDEPAMNLLLATIDDHNIEVAK